jgi:hypothetical protein
MVEENRQSDEAFLERINIRLETWRRFWIFFLGFYFFFGIASVTLSTIAATDLVLPGTRQLLSLLAAVCIAIIAFVKPEARYKNLVRAWRELEAEKTRYLFGTTVRESLISTLARAERIATDDEPHSREETAS